MFDTTYRLPEKTYSDPDSFDLELPIDRHWKKSTSRVLIVNETVDSRDLKAGRLLSERSRTVWTNLLKFSEQEAAKISGSKVAVAYAMVNFNNAKTFHLSTEVEVAPYLTHFTERVHEAIDYLEPTQIIVSGDKAMRHLFPDVPLSEWKRGWVHTVKVHKKKVKVTSTLDLEPLYIPKKTDLSQEDDADEEQGGRDIYGKSNLLGYVSRNIVNNLLGHHAWSLRDLTPSPVYIDTIEKFDRFFAKLSQCTKVAVDTETCNLSATKNQIFTIQFAFTSDRGYVIPLRHPKTPFSPDEIKYIHRKLRQWFGASPEPDFKFMIYMNGKFDLKVLRAELGLPIILRPLWEVTAGEHGLDENLKFLSSFGTKAGNLRAILTSYDNDLYWTLPFSKDERATIAFIKPSDPDFLDYASLDVQCLIALQKMQMRRSATLKLGRDSYQEHFYKLVREQMSNTVHTLSHMEGRGIQLDTFYLAYLKSKESPLLQSMEATKAELFAMPSVKKANRLLVKGMSESVSTGGGLFNKTGGAWVFNLNKPDHKTTLFFDVMELEPISYTKTKKPQVDKNFQKAYQDDYREVKLFATWQETFKLWGTYIKGWYLKIKEGEDNDGRLRPSYGFFDVVTGRLNSFDPSLHQVPSRGAQAKKIKRAFVAPAGSLHVKYDYSAHEVRFWGIVSGDDVIADTFRVGQKLRKKFRKNPTPELAAQIKKQGDVHIINIYHFFQKWVEKSDPLREAIKAVVFGTIYQMSVNSLAKSLRKQRYGELDAKIRSSRKEIAKLKEEKPEGYKAKLEELRKTLATSKDELYEVENRDWKKFAGDLVQKLFNRYSVGAKWIDKVKRFAENNLYIYSPTGRRRNLYGILAGLQGMTAALLRRAVNSPIQGIASEVTATAARLTSIHFYKFLCKFYPEIKYKILPGEALKLVHDATYAEVIYRHFLSYLHITQWVATYGVTQYYEDTFGITFNIEPEIEIEVGASEDAHYKWDWTDKNLREIVKKSLEDQVKLKLLDKDKLDRAFNLVFSEYKDPRVKRYLETHYPILGVK